jgi:hypothetical protein
MNQEGPNYCFELVDYEDVSMMAFIDTQDCC